MTRTSFINWSRWDQRDEKFLILRSLMILGHSEPVSLSHLSDKLMKLDTRLSKYLLIAVLWWVFCQNIVMLSIPSLLCYHDHGHYSWYWSWHCTTTLLCPLTIPDTEWLSLARFYYCWASGWDRESQKSLLLSWICLQSTVLVWSSSSPGASPPLHTHISHSSLDHDTWTPSPAHTSR